MDQRKSYIGRGQCAGMVGMAHHQIARYKRLVHNGAMKKAEAISRLKPFEHRLRERGINALYLFGSTARDEANAASDLDLLYEYDPARPFSLFDQAGAMLELSDALETRVDLVSRMGLRPRLRARVEGEMVRVF
jgi:predicted nucleotidyltransferase